ncbi:hypothetical protein MMC18_005407 [Xylographa bjoerkii]|nr:hypothetical protein [Xylographa bjoerkii]
MAELIGGLAGSLQGTATGFINGGQNLLDRFFPPERRSELWAKFNKFATEKPMLASFLLSQIALSGIPIALFVVMTIGVFVFALVAALVIGVLGALLFTAFCVGVALLVLLPVLFITTFAGAFIWLWGVGTYYILKWFNQKDIPGIHSGALDGITGGKESDSTADSAPATNGESKTHPKHEETEDHPKHKQARKSGGKPNGVAGNLPGADKLDDVGKATGLDSGPVGDVKKKADVGNITKTADVGNVTKKADLGKVKGSVPGGLL